MGFCIDIGHTSHSGADIVESIATGPRLPREYALREGDYPRRSRSHRRLSPGRFCPARRPVIASPSQNGRGFPAHAPDTQMLHRATCGVFGGIFASHTRRRYGHGLARQRSATRTGGRGWRPLGFVSLALRNILADVRANGHFMGEEFSTAEVPTLTVNPQTKKAARLSPSW